ncbi:MAG: flagellar biosynthetic protein FliR [Succinivibrio sp.]|nr:flagellar biosynthetic protein FliR [Succinivibrio sp.]
MEMLSALAQDPTVVVYVYSIMLALPRLLILTSIASVFGPAVTMMIKFPLAASILLPLLPFLVFQGTVNSITELPYSTIALLAVKEVFLGFILGYVSNVFFSAAIAGGMIVDNQRGASQAQGQDLILDEQNSPFGSVLMLTLVTLFYASGAVIGYIGIIMTSYLVWPVNEFLPAIYSAETATYTGYLANLVMSYALVLCAPFMLVSLMTDLSLGLINRFAPQLNVFILSMPIKSGLCAVLILFFVQPYMEIGGTYLERMSTLVHNMLKLISPTY